MSGGLSSAARGAVEPFSPAQQPCCSALLLVVVYTPPAHALPSFARQTGQPCGTCHTDYAGLTPYGRRFKIEGYTAGGGPYRPTLFPSSDDTHDQKHWVPPISMMTVVGFTNTQAPLPPPTAPYNANNNVVVSPSQLFLGRCNHRSHRRVRAIDLQRTTGRRIWHRPIRRTHMDLGQHRRPLCEFDEIRQSECHLRHHGQ